MEHSLLQKIGAALLAAFLIGGATTVADNKITNTRQDVEIAEFRTLKSEIGTLNTQLNEANKGLAVLNERLPRDE